MPLSNARSPLVLIHVRASLDRKKSHIPNQHLPPNVKRHTLFPQFTGIIHTYGHEQTEETQFTGEELGAGVWVWECNRMGVIEDTESKVAALRLRLPDLDGKANKRERTRVNKDIYELEQGEQYVQAVRALIETNRVVATAAAASVDIAVDDARSHAVQEAAGNNAEAKAQVVGLHFRRQVEDLFDEYAPSFERELTGGLKYRSPQILEEALVALPRRPGMSEGVVSESLAIDLGCGTGVRCQ